MPTHTSISSVIRFAEHAIGGLDRHRGAYLLRRLLAGEMKSAKVLLSDSMDAARVLAGEDYEAACVPPAARAVLSRFDDRSAQYEVRLTPTGELAPVNRVSSGLPWERR